MGIAGIVGFRRGVDDFRWFFGVVVAGLWFLGGFYPNKTKNKKYSEMFCNNKKYQ